MKPLCWLMLFPLLASAAVGNAAVSNAAVSNAAVRDDYARQWPLTLQDDAAGAYRITLDREIYRSAQSPTLRDVDVVNADGAEVPSALFAASQPLAQEPRYLVLPWFPLPPGKAAQAQDIAVISERAVDGSVRRVETRVSGATSTPSSAANAWLIDASRMREAIIALQLSWSPVSTALDATYRAEGSDDLRTWRSLQAQIQLLDLVRDGQRLQQRRIPLDGSAKYIRLLPVGDGAAPALTGVRAEVAASPAALAWMWEALPGRIGIGSAGSGQDSSKRGVSYYEFALRGRFPIEQADLTLDGNNAAEWTLQSRDSGTAPWQTRAGPWVAFQVGAGGAANRSAAQALGGVIRDRFWRLSSSTPAAVAPTLRLGYRPEVMVFVAQGRPPFALVAGSARARRGDAPLPQLVDALRVRHGGNWQPASAALGPPQVLAGDAAYVPTPVARDWKTWLLWALLVGGALIVVAFAIDLLRKPAETRG